jgi:hypothetical protein
MDKTIKTIPISDLGCATSIVCENILPIELMKDKTSPKVFFVFEDTPIVREISDRYWLGKQKSISREYFENLKMLKNRIYTLKDYGK